MMVNGKMIKGRVRVEVLIKLLGKSIVATSLIIVIMVMDV